MRKADAMLADTPLVIRPGRVEDVICRTAGEQRDDLIVAGALEREGALQYFLGSVARRIARHAPCSVLLLSEPHLPPSPFHRIVAAVKFDDVSSRMMQLVARLASRGRTQELHVVSEYDLSGLRLAIAEGADARGPDEQRKSIHAQETVRLAAFLHDIDLKGLRPRLEALEGKDGWEPVQYARRQQADLLFFPAPTQPPSFWAKLFQHGYEFALQSLPCALFLYRAAGDASGREAMVSSEAAGGEPAAETASH
jgi:nucleotide-binding universal stress UspA family protein